MNSGQKLALRILVILLISSAAYYLNHQGLLRKSLEWVEGLGPWSPVLFMALCVPAPIFFIPSIVFTFAAGVLFGLSRGMLFSLAGTTMGSVGALLIGRYLAKDWISRRFSKDKRFQLLGEMARLKGWKIVALARLSPIFPFLIGNYIFGLTPISAKSYFAASLVGSIPSTAVYVYLGTLSRNLAFLGDETRARTPGEWLLLFGGLAATVVLTFYLKHVAQATMSEKFKGGKIL